ncbi:MAG: HK97 gp10 family phage protein [Hungatella sp.]|nr:HK97 gp10 family phage protein [Hungatella sp.]
MTGGIKGLDSLMKKYNNMTGNVTGPGLEKAVGASIKMVQGEAKLLCPVNDGELRESIKTSVYSQDEKVIGAAYTNKKHGPYVEFGTGPKGEADHAGISPKVSPSYTQSPWWIHETAIHLGCNILAPYTCKPFTASEKRFSGRYASVFKICSA